MSEVLASGANTEIGGHLSDNVLDGACGGRFVPLHAWDPHHNAASEKGFVETHPLLARLHWLRLHHL